MMLAAFAAVSTLILGDVYTKAKDLVSPGGLEVSVTDASFKQLGGAFVVEDPVIPSTDDGCEVKLAEWASRTNGALPVFNVYRIKVTNSSRSEILLEEVEAKVKSTRSLSRNARQYSCPSGEPLSEVAADVRLNSPVVVAYSSPDQPQRRDLSYRLEPGEVGVFYITNLTGYSEGLDEVVWQAVLKYSSKGDETHALDINTESGIGYFRSGPSCADLWLQQGSQWKSFAEASCAPSN